MELKKQLRVSKKQIAKVFIIVDILVKERKSYGIFVVLSRKNRIGYQNRFIIFTKKYIRI